MESVKSRIEGLMDLTIIPALNEDFETSEREGALELLKEKVAELKIEVFVE